MLSRDLCRWRKICLESLAGKEKAGEGMNGFIQKYINLYSSNMTTKATLWLKRQISLCQTLFLGAVVVIGVSTVSLCHKQFVGDYY